MPSWFSSSLGYSPPDPPGNRRFPFRSRSCARSALSRVPIEPLPQRLHRSGVGLVSLESANPYEVSPLDQPASSKEPSAGLWIPLGCPRALPPRPTLYALSFPLPELSGLAFRAEIGRAHV